MNQASIIIAKESSATDAEQEAENLTLIAREERRQLTKEYRGLIKKFEELKQAPEENNLTSLTEGVTESSKLFSKVKELGFQHARNLKIDGQVFDRAAYLKCLQNYIGINTNIASRSTSDDDDNTNWNKLGQLASRCMNRVPTIDFMLGPLNIQQQKRRKINRPRGIILAKEAIQPQKLAQGDLKQQENDTTSNVKHVWDILSKVGPINLFEFIINPYHFGQSVENLFYLSFLIRDGRAEIFMSGEHLMAKIAQPPSQNDYLNGLQKKQLVMELDSHSWASLIDTFNIKRPIIPDRSPTSSLTNDFSGGIH